MSEQPQIKPVDLAAVWRIRRAVLFPDRPIEKVKLKDDPAGTHLGIFLDNEPVSVISLFDHDGICQFRKFATLREHQGKGYGSLLLQRVMTIAKDRSAISIWCNARLSACTLYERFGMHPIGDSWEENGHAYIKMEKQL